jgi:hypothetical protein
MSLYSQNVKGLTLSDGWNGLTVEQWSDFIFQPSRLLENPTTIFKSEDENVTVLKQVEHGGEKVLVVVKKAVCRNRMKNLSALFIPPKAVRNFRVAFDLMDKGIEVAEPIAALWRKKGFQSLENIHIAQFSQDSINLYDVAFGKNKEIITNFRVRKDVIRQVAAIIAKLHKSWLWHRDSKAGNFVVYKNVDDSYKVKLIDLDGIKPNLFNKEKYRIRTLSKLAETLSRFKTVNFTDLYRGFLVYCDEMQIDRGQMRQLFDKVERATVALRLLTIISDSYKLKEK